MQGNQAQIGWLRSVAAVVAKRPDGFLLPTIPMITLAHDYDWVSHACHWEAQGAIEIIVDDQRRDRLNDLAAVPADRCAIRVLQPGRDYLATLPKGTDETNRRP